MITRAIGVDMKRCILLLFLMVPLVHSAADLYVMKMCVFLCQALFSSISPLTRCPYYTTAGIGIQLPVHRPTSASNLPSEFPLSGRANASERWSLTTCFLLLAAFHPFQFSFPVFSLCFPVRHSPHTPFRAGLKRAMTRISIARHLWQMPPPKWP